MHAQPRRQRADGRSEVIDEREAADQHDVKRRELEELAVHHVVDDHERVHEHEQQHRQVLQAQQRMQLPRVAEADHEVGDVRALPAQLLVEITAQVRRGLREAERVHRQARLVAALDDLMGEEAVLAVLDRDAEDVAVLEHRLELEQHLAAIRGQTARQAQHLIERALEVLQMLLAEVVLDRLQSREPVLVRVRDVDAAADRGDLGAGEARDELAQRGWIDDHVGVDRDDHLGARGTHGGVDALALAHVEFVAQHTNVAERGGGLARPFAAVVGGAIVDHRDLELVGGIVELDEALDGVVDRAAFVEQRDDDRDRRFVAIDLLIQLLAAKQRQVEPEHVAVQEHDEDEQVDRKLRHAGRRESARRAPRGLRKSRNNVCATLRARAIEMGSGVLPTVVTMDLSDNATHAFGSRHYASRVVAIVLHSRDCSTCHRIHHSCVSSPPLAAGRGSSSVPITRSSTSGLHNSRAGLITSAARRCQRSPRRC